MKKQASKFHLELPKHADIRRYWVAYSGGLDSQVLLHMMATGRKQTDNIEIRAIHINHGLSQNARDWQQHCLDQCASLDIPLVTVSVDAKPQQGESPEAAARDARYAAFAELVEHGDCLLTAHHQDDQAETLLLQLLRGAGPKGLAAMPGFNTFAAGFHARPLLKYTRDDLLAYARQWQLDWIEDESNQDTGLDRNFLRHQIMPILKHRFPAAASTLSRSAALCAEAAELLEMQAVADLTICRKSLTSLSVARLKDLGETRARNVLHHFIHYGGFPLPNEVHFRHIWNDVVLAATDSCPVVCWPGAEIRRYRDELYLTKPLSEFDHSQVFDWDMNTTLSIAQIGVLSVKPSSGRHAISGEWVRQCQSNGLQVKFRQGGEKIQPAGRDGHHSLKHLFQEAGIPPWQRDRIPLIFRDEKLIAVTGYWIDHDVAAQPAEQGWQPVLIN